MDGFRLPPQAVTRQAIDLADQSLSHDFEPLHQGPGLIELAEGRVIFEIRRQHHRPAWRTSRADRGACGRPRATAARPGSGVHRPHRRVESAYRSEKSSHSPRSPSASSPQAASKTTGSSRLAPSASLRLIRLSETPGRPTIRSMARTVPRRGSASTRYSSMPAARQLSRSSCRERAVKAMTGRCPPAACSRSRIAR